MPRQLNAAERVRLRLNEWAIEVGHGAGKRLGEAVSGKFGEQMSPQWASGILSGKSDLRLKDLDAVAELLGVPPGDLVRRDGDHYLELIPTEMLFVRYLRGLPDTVRKHLLHVCDYFYAFQDGVLKAQRAQVDLRTKAARAQRKNERRMDEEHKRKARPA